MIYYDPFYWRKGRWPYQQFRYPKIYRMDDPLQQLGLNRYQRPILSSYTYYGTKPKPLYYCTSYGTPIIWR